MKQTAVIWLIEQLKLFKLLKDNNLLTSEEWKELFEQAKEIEKEQIKFFFEKGHLYSGCPYGFDEIYNKTFKSE